ncbi:ABC transporter permease [Rufibacter ruber]|uniref:ABC transporter permease n=1 Tax=Rufibacter ruber TaxID=1783499 RepID=UPI00082FEA4E|nr:ABC transporter permease subunit [Rufibacter ruber]
MDLKASLLPFKKGRYIPQTIWALLWQFAFFIIACLAYIFDEDSVTSNLQETYLPPFVSNAHVLGTDHLGRDVLSSLLLSCKTAWWLTFPPLLLANILGVSLGAAAATLGNHHLKCTIASLVRWFLFSFLVWYSWELQRQQLLSPLLSAEFSNYSFLLSLLVSWVLSYVLYKILLLLPLFRKKSTIPVDSCFQKISDLWSTLPKLLLIVLLSVFAAPSLASMVVWISLSYWVYPGRLTRTALLSLRQEPYIEAAIALGTPPLPLFRRHLWPTLKGSLLVNFCFTASGLLGVGATLSFLGIGLPSAVPSWGKMLSVARLSLEAWWLFAFPAVFLLLSVLSLQVIGSRLSFKRRD